jgi:hypothetical protein
LQDTGIAIPALIGKRMAESAKLKKGDVLLMQWRDKYGTFDARNAKLFTYLRNIFRFEGVSEPKIGEIVILRNNL